MSSSFFSISFELVPMDQPLPYDLYINSSVLESRERYVRIFPRGQVLTPVDLQDFRRKYRQLYLSESQRADYLRSLCQSSGRAEAEKVTVLKDSAIHYLQNIFEPKKEFSSELLTQTISGCRDVVENMVDLIDKHDIDTLKELIGSLSFHDFYTYDHSINVSMYCILLYRFSNPQASRAEIVQAGLGGLLHDVGKLKIPTQIINKPDKLSPEEWKQIQMHPDYGKEFITMEGVQLPNIVDPDLLCRTIHEHHENYDGTGYPSKKAGTDIHALARVTAIADFFDAITTKRAYSKPLSTEEALTLMGDTQGKKIDPKLFEIFAKNTQHFSKNQQTLLELPPDFDACQPCKLLPLRHKRDGKKFGDILIVGADKKLGKLKKVG